MAQSKSVVGSIRSSIGNTWKSGKRGKVGIGCVALLLSCVVCSVCAQIYSMTPQAQETARATAQAVAIAQNTTPLITETVDVSSIQTHAAMDVFATQTAGAPTVAPTATSVPTVAPAAASVPTVAPAAASVPTVAPTLTTAPVSPTALPTIEPVPSEPPQSSAPPTVATEAPEPVAGIGITRSEIQSRFEAVGFSFEQGAPVNGQDNLVGSLDNASVQLIGPAQNLTEASVFVALGGADESARARAAVYLLGLMVAVQPDWEGGIDWINDNLQNATEGKEASIVRGNIRTNLIVSETLGAILLIFEGVAPN